jgi:CHAT domain-containing protein
MANFPYRLWASAWFIAFLVCRPAGAAQVGDPLARVQDLLLAGKRAEATVVVQKAQRIFAQAGDRRHEALSLLLLAAAELGEGNFTSARADFERSATLLEAAGDPFGACMALYSLGILENAKQRPAEAVALYRRALALLSAIDASSASFSVEDLKYFGRFLDLPADLLDALPTRPESVMPLLLRIVEARCRLGVVDALVDSNRLADAESELTQLTELNRRLGGRFNIEEAEALGALRRRQRRLDEAREILRKALEEPSLQPAEELTLLDDLLDVDLETGRLAEAIALSDRALALSQQFGDPEMVVLQLITRADILAEGHDYDAAAQILKKALAIARASGGDAMLALVVRSLGSVAQDRDRYEEAAAFYEEAARLFHSLQRLEEEGSIWLQLCALYAHLGSHAGAEAALEKARDLSRQSRSRLLAGKTELFAAEERFRFHEGSFKELETRLLEVLALSETQDNPRPEDARSLRRFYADCARFQGGARADRETFCSTSGDGSGQPPESRALFRLLCGAMRFQRGDFAAARDVWLAALAEQPAPSLEAYLQALVGECYVWEKKDQEAIGYLLRSVRIVEQTIENVRLEDRLAGYMGNYQFSFASLIELLVRNGRATEAFEYAERARARGFLEGLGNPRLALRQGADPQLIREAEELRQQVLALERRAIWAAAKDQEQLGSELQQARERYQSVLVRLKVTNPGLAARAKVEPLHVEDVRKELPSDTSLVSYFVSFNQIHAWVLDKENLVHVALPLGPQDLRRAVCWAAEMERGGGGRGVRRLDPGCEEEAASAEEVYLQLIAPLRPSIHHRRLIVIPHAELHYLPFAALRDPGTGRYLVEDYTLTYAPSASVLGLLAARETPMDGRALVLGAPREHDPRLRSIPAARKEAEVVGRLLGTRPLLGPQASEGRLYKLAGKIDLLHIAAHGLYEPRSPLFSRITLAPDKDHDGNLEVHEILSDLDLSGVNLVVLSACETARGERSRGDEITGLTRAFLYAGSPGVISTLWNIDDEAAAVLMQDFYRRLLAGAAVADALREAQLHLLHGRKYRDPYFWAAFSLTGDPHGRWNAAGAVVRSK